MQKKRKQFLFSFFLTANAKREVFIFPFFDIFFETSFLRREKEFFHHKKETKTWKEMVYYLEAVVSPRAKLHDARLLVERKVFYVDLARGFVYGRWLPFDPPCVIQRRLRCQRYLEITVSAVPWKTNRSFDQ